MRRRRRSLRQRLRRSVRAWLNRLLAIRGLELRDLHSHPERHARVMQLLRQHVGAPGTVIDVGVGKGTPWLYDGFPDAKLVLIEPNPFFEETVQRLAAHHGADAYHVAVGAEDGHATLHTDLVQQASSSLLTRSGTLDAALGARPHQPVNVPMRTLDNLLASRAYPAPFLLKIDTEGYELAVLRGATVTLKEAAAVIAEVSVVERFEQSYAFADLIAFMQAHGFRLFDVLAVSTLGKQGPAGYMDLAFVRPPRSIAAASPPARAAGAR